MTRIEKKYNHRVIVTMTIYCVLLFSSTYMLQDIAADWPVWCKALLAVVPVIPVAFFCKAYVTYLNECDELLQRIELEAIGLSTVVVGLLYLSLGFLGRAKIIALDGITVAVWVFPLLCGFYGLTKWLASRRYR
jgi:hypothetical protein